MKIFEKKFLKKFVKAIQKPKSNKWLEILVNIFV